MTQLQAILDAGHLNANAKALFERNGWMVWQDNSDYTDLETDVTFRSADETGDEDHTFNLHLTFDWANKNVYMAAGTNFGEGFNPALDIPHLGGSLSADITHAFKELQPTDGNFLTLVNQYPNDWSTLRLRVKHLSNELELA